MPRQEDQPAVDTPVEEAVNQPIEQVVDTPVQESPVEPVQQSQPKWYEQLLGEDAKGLDESAALERLRHRQQEFDRISNEHNQYRTLLYQERQAQARAQAAQAQQKPVESKRKVPEFDPDWLNYVKRDEQTGELVAKAHADPTLPAKIAAYAKYRDDVNNSFVRDPVAFFKENVFADVQNEIQSLVQNQLQQYHHTMAVNSWENQYRDILYQPGTQNLTPAGQRILQYAQRHMAAGVQDQVSALNLATKDLHYEMLMAGQLNQQQQTPPAAPANGQAQAKEQFQREQAAKRRPNRDGAIPNSETNGAPRPRFNFKEEALKQLETIGVGRHDRVIQ